MRNRVAALVSIITLRGNEGFSVGPTCAKTRLGREASTTSLKATAMSTVTTPSWSDLQTEISASVVGSALDQEVNLRQEGKGSAHGGCINDTCYFFRS